MLFDEIRRVGSLTIWEQDDDSGTRFALEVSQILTKRKTTNKRWAMPKTETNNF
jgi:hypothetical protein